MPAGIVLKLWRGNSGTRANPDGIVIDVISGDEPAQMGGTEIVFRVVANGVEIIRRSTADGGVLLDAAAGRVTIPISVADSRAIPDQAQYEIEQRAGAEQRTILYGYFQVSGGVNDD